MVRSFGELTAAQDELRPARDALETRVQPRTADLGEANLALRKDIDGGRRSTVGAPGDPRSYREE